MMFFTEKIKMKNMGRLNTYNNSNLYKGDKTSVELVVKKIKNFRGGQTKSLRLNLIDWRIQL